MREPVVCSYIGMPHTAYAATGVHMSQTTSGSLGGGVGRRGGGKQVRKMFKVKVYSRIIEGLVRTMLIRAISIEGCIGNV